jgi:hypothetical protein
VVHGLLTLAALPVESERPGEQVYRAIWLRKGQGFSLIREDGYIIRRAGELAHGPSISACRATLTRRLNLVAQPERDEALRLKLSGPLSGLNGCSQVLVHLRHSKAAGNCGPGTLAFRDRHFPGRESATVAELLSAAEQAGPDIRQRVIAACVIACRRIAATA